MLFVPATKICQGRSSLGALQELVKFSSRTYQPDRFSVKFDTYLAKYWMRGVNLRLFQYAFGTHP